MATIKELFPSDSLLWLEFGGIYTDSAGNKVIDNLATRGDAPARVTCGAGAACPTQLSGRRGVVFAGAQYIDCGLIDRFERTDAFTLFVLVQAATAASVEFISSQDEAQGNRGIALAAYSRQTYAYITSTYWTNMLLRNTTAGYYNRTVDCIAMTYTGSSALTGVNLYINGNTTGHGVEINNLSATIKSGKPFILGARHNGAGKSTQYTGNMHFAAIFPLAASQLQLQNLHKRVLKRINLP